MNMELGYVDDEDSEILERPPELSEKNVKEKKGFFRKTKKKSDKIKKLSSKQASQRSSIDIRRPSDETLPATTPQVLISSNDEKSKPERKRTGSKAETSGTGPKLERQGTGTSLEGQGKSTQLERQGSNRLERQGTGSNLERKGTASNLEQIECKNNEKGDEIQKGSEINSISVDHSNPECNTSKIIRKPTDHQTVSSCEIDVADDKFRNTFSTTSEIRGQLEEIPKLSNSLVLMRQNEIRKMKSKEYKGQKACAKCLIF